MDKYSISCGLSAKYFYVTIIQQILNYLKKDSVIAKSKTTIVLLIKNLPSSCTVFLLILRRARDRRVHERPH